MSASTLKRSGFFSIAQIDRRYAGPHTHDPFQLFRKLGQGMGAGYFTVTGSSAVASPNFLTTDLTSFDALSNAFFSGALNGPLQLAGAVLLFMMAGRCLIRFAGVLIVLAAFGLHSQGVTLAEIATFISQFAQRMSAAIEAFRSAPVA